MSEFFPFLHMLASKNCYEIRSYPFSTVNIGSEIYAQKVNVTNYFVLKDLRITMAYKITLLYGILILFKQFKYFI